MIQTLTDIRNAYDEGRFWWGLFRRGGPAMTANVYADMSYAAGIPVANYYASTPYVSAILNGRDGIDLGPDPAPGLSKYIAKATLMPPTATGLLEFRFLDVVMYYPFFDGDGGYQDAINSVAIPRYSGANCRIMVVSQGVGTGTVNVLVTYTNSDGITGRQVTVTLNLAQAAGSLCSSHAPGSAIAAPPSPFLPLCNGCKGVRSIESVEYLGAGGGIQAFVIIKPLWEMSMFEATLAPIEVDFTADRTLMLPQYEPGAYLSAIARGTAASTPATIHALIETIWG